MNKCIYHHPCVDGWCSAYLVKKRFPDCQLIPMNYNNELDLDSFSRDDEVIVCDFSFPREMMQALFDRVGFLVVLDHHKTAEANLEGLPYCFFDMNRSGAKMTWDYFYPGMAPNPIVNYVQDRDLWKWRFPKSKQINAAINLYPFAVEEWDRLFATPLTVLIAKGEDVLKVHGEFLERILKGVLPGKLRDYRTGFVNSGILQSEIGEALKNDYEVIAAWHFNGKQVNVSLRSREVDVSEVAKTFGGGGHKLAAGFNVSLKEWLEML